MNFTTEDMIAAVIAGVVMAKSANKILAIKALRSYTTNPDLGLKAAKDIIDTAAPNLDHALKYPIVTNIETFSVRPTDPDLQTALHYFKMLAQNRVLLTQKKLEAARAEEAQK